MTAIAAVFPECKLDKRTPGARGGTVRCAGPGWAQLALASGANRKFVLLQPSSFSPDGVQVVLSVAWSLSCSTQTGCKHLYSDTTHQQQQSDTGDTAPAAAYYCHVPKRARSLLQFVCYDLPLYAKMPV